MLTTILFLSIWSCTSPHGETKDSSDLTESKISKEYQTDRCNIQSVVDVKMAITSEKLNKDLLVKFLYSFDDSCKNNAEYSQFSNAILFTTLEHHSSLVIEILAENGELNHDYIFSEISRPIHDGIDLNKIFESVEKSESDAQIKDKLLESLKVAINR